MRLIISPFYRWGNSGTEELSYLLKITQLSIVNPFLASVPGSRKAYTRLNKHSSFMWIILGNFPFHLLTGFILFKYFNSLKLIIHSEIYDYFLFFVKMNLTGYQGHKTIVLYCLLKVLNF